MPLLFSLSCTNEVSKELNEIILDSAVSWQKGFLDIHHINTGHGDAAFMIFPDATTLLFDAGDLDDEKFNGKYYPMKATASKPNNSKSAAEWLDQYIRLAHPLKDSAVIDYALISHYHSDHYAAFAELSNLITIKKIIDRNANDLDYPVDLIKYYKNDPIFQEYLRLLQDDKIIMESLRAGIDDQIYLRNDKESYPHFNIRNVKANGLIWSGASEDVIEFLPGDSLIDENGEFNENPLSLAIVVNYGCFDYFTGGDMTGLRGYGLPSWFDVETPTAAAVGEIDVTTLNHHGNRDATNANFLSTLQPQVLVQQSWCSDHPGQEVLHRMNSKYLYPGPRDVFATNIHPETMVTLGVWFEENYKSTSGHILVRVKPGGDEFFVYILDDSIPGLRVKDVFGPYLSKD